MAEYIERKKVLANIRSFICDNECDISDYRRVDNGTLH